MFSGTNESASVYKNALKNWACKYYLRRRESESYFQCEHKIYIFRKNITFNKSKKHKNTSIKMLQIFRCCKKIFGWKIFGEKTFRQKTFCGQTFCPTEICLTWMVIWQMDIWKTDIWQIGIWQKDIWQKDLWWIDI